MIQNELDQIYDLLRLSVVNFEPINTRIENFIIEVPYPPYMACQICGGKSGFYPLCSKHFKARDKGEVSKCEDCGIWKRGDKPLCYDCWKAQSKTTQEGVEIDLNKGASDTAKAELSFRKKFPANRRATDGHEVRSKAELIIDNWLFNSRIVHAYEYKVNIEEDLYCDWMIPNGHEKVFVEYWGMEENKQYAARKAKKIKLYENYDLKLVELLPEDEDILDDAFPKKLRDAGLEMSGG